MIYAGEPHDTFRASQSGHPCTDCGLDDRELGIGAARLEVIGGGSIIRSRAAPLREIHVVPHGGTELPGELLADVGEAGFGELARLVHDNSDIGTRAIYMALARRVADGRLRAAVAAFHVSRLLVDANRLRLAEQIPAAPYTGSAELYGHFVDRHRARLSAELARPWIDAVNGLLTENDGCPVYHHHTMDVYSLSPRGNDKSASYDRRPPFQLVWRQHPAAPAGEGAALAPYGLLARIRSAIAEFFAQGARPGDTDGGIDYPLGAPLMPFHGCGDGPPAQGTFHVLYDVRKDMLDSAGEIERWVLERPWSVPG